MQTFLIISAIVIAIAFLLWRAYRALQRSACCGTCGCNLMSEKQKKKMLAKREELVRKRATRK
ncbi:MAG: hypothetical protein ACSHX6_13225 [Akkermansiaceae bacterium]